MRRPIVAFIGLFVAGHAIGGTYEFRGAELGSPIEALRSMPYPDLGASNLGAGIEAAVRLVCTGDVSDPIASPMQVYGWLKEAGVVKCAWMIAPDRSAYRFSWDNAGLKVGDDWSNEPVYQFLPDASGSVRLQRVFVPLPVGAYQGVLDALTAKYGKPKESVTGEVQNRLGAKFDSAVSMWDDGTATITLAARATSVDSATLLLEHKALGAIFEAAKQKAEGEPKI